MCLHGAYASFPRAKGIEEFTVDRIVDLQEAKQNSDLVWRALVSRVRLILSVERKSCYSVSFG